MRQLSVRLSNFEYPIFIGTSLLTKINLLPLKQHSKIALISDENVATLYLETVKNAFINKGFTVDTFVLPAGEKHKNQQTWSSILTFLIEQHHTRQSTLIALGGGVIGDMVGFSAACYLRGVNFIQMPTSLLAQVDSSVGGKTAINHALGKNMIGAFYQPQAVLIDVETLKTLPDREFFAGLAEVIKYGVILDASFFAWLEANIDALLAKKEAQWIECIARCCTIKAKIVQEDEKEQGERALLNLGHTYGHAIETALGFGTWLHGEAVAIGLLMASHLSRLMNQLTQADFDRIHQLLARAHLPTKRPCHFDPEAYLPIMKRDKKTQNNHFRLVIPTQIGKGKIIELEETSLILKSIQMTEKESKAKK